MKELKIRVTTTEEMLGTAPADPEIYKNWIASNAPETADTTEEIKAVEDAAETEEEDNGIKSMTVFPRVNGQPIMWDYQWKGFFKDACASLRKVPDTKSSKIKAFKKEIDGLIFVVERVIPITFEGEIGVCQRPLRAQTAQGERVALAISEAIPAGAVMEFTIRCLLDAHMDAVKEWLNYGLLRGIGQWRNASKGRFTYEVIEEKKLAA